jgi:hypothetical protein
MATVAVATFSGGGGGGGEGGTYGGRGGGRGGGGGVSRWSRVWIFFRFEHAVLVLRFALETIEIQAARTERLVEKVINLTPDEEADDARLGLSSSLVSWV